MNTGAGGGALAAVLMGLLPTSADDIASVEEVRGAGQSCSLQRRLVALSSGRSLHPSHPPPPQKPNHGLLLEAGWIYE